LRIASNFQIHSESQIKFKKFCLKFQKLPSGNQNDEKQILLSHFLIALNAFIVKCHPRVIAPEGNNQTLKVSLFSHENSRTEWIYISLALARLPSLLRSHTRT
jgi:hypothetical protein